MQLKALRTTHDAAPEITNLFQVIMLNAFNVSTLATTAYLSGMGLVSGALLAFCGGALLTIAQLLAAVLYFTARDTAAARGPMAAAPRRAVRDEQREALMAAWDVDLIDDVIAAREHKDQNCA